MPQDAYTLKYLCSELNGIFSGGKVNRIIQPSNDQVILTIYTGKRTERLLLDVNPSSPRIGILTTEKNSPLTAPNFCMLLRKHLLSASIDNISILGFDRIVKIDFTTSSEFFDSEKKCLYIELMGRYSNIILTQDDKILGGNRGINMFDNGVRPLIVGHRYILPPTNDKKTPDDESLVEYFKNCTENISDYICAGVQGVAKSTAVEIVSDYFLNKDLDNLFIQNNSEDFVTFLKNFLYNTTPQPVIIFDEKEVKDVCVKDYKQISGERKYFSNLWEAEEYYFQVKTSLKEFSEKKLRLENIVNSALKKSKKKMSAITSREKEALYLEENKLKGELIISNLYKIKNGITTIKLENFYDDNNLIEIELEKELSPTQNAEKYFKKYNKQKRTLTMLAPQKQMIQAEIDYLTSVSDEISLCESLSELISVQSELELGGFITLQNKNTKKKEQIHYREYIVDNFTIKVGRNNAENDFITSSARGEYTWLHSKDYHSAHVIIESESIPQKIILIAAEICAYYSKGREGGKTEVVYTLKKFVKKPPKSKLGFCTYSNFSSVVVKPLKHEELLKTL